MKVRLLYFARLREAFASSGEEVDLPEHVRTAGELVAWLRARGGVWATELSAGRSFRVAIDQEMAGEGTPIGPGAEVALFPPVTGG